MIKNINELLSFIVLSLLAIYAINLLIFSYIKSHKIDHDIDLSLSKWQLFKDYNDNIEE